MSLVYMRLTNLSNIRQFNETRFYPIIIIIRHQSHQGRLRTSYRSIFCWVLLESIQGDAGEGIEVNRNNVSMVSYGQT